LDADSAHSYDALSLDMQLDIDIVQNRFHAIVEMRISVTSDELPVIPIHHPDDWQGIVQVNGVQTTWEPISANEANIINPLEVNTGDTLEVTMCYSNPLRRDNSFGGMVYNPELDVVFTFGEPYRTRLWLACYDLPFDKIITRMTVRMDCRYKVLSNGRLSGETDNGDGTTTTFWENRDPISTYLISLAASPYVVIESEAAGVNKIPVHFWAFPKDSALASEEFGRTSLMIDYFETLFGPYPFNKYDQAMAPIFNGWGAMEHQTCTTYGQALVEAGQRQYEGVVAHELAHQWWGNLVTPLTFADIWLNEGFASYSDALWAERQSSERFHQVMSNFRDWYFGEDDDPQRGRFPIYNPPLNDNPGAFNPMFSATVYDKGAWVLHTLRWVMGDDDFFTGLQHYVALYAYGNSTTDEFKAAMEEVSGIDLTAFFDEWVYRAGYPIYRFSKLDWVSQDSFNVASIIVEQVQTEAPYFSTPLPIRLHGEMLDTLLRVEIEPLASQQIILGEFLSLGEMEFDPEEWILCGNHCDNNVWNSYTGLLPDQLSISPAFPNPFNSQTSLDVFLPATGYWRVEVYNLLGQQIGLLGEGIGFRGMHRLVWEADPAAVASGVYFITVSTQYGGRASQRVHLIR